MVGDAMRCYAWHPSVADMLVTEDGALVLTDVELLDLSPLSQLVMTLCERTPQSAERLTRACVDEFGAPGSGSASERVRQALEHLEAAQLLHVVDC